MCSISFTRLRLLGLFRSAEHAPLLGQFFFVFGAVLAHSFTIFLWIRLPSSGHRSGQFFFVFRAVLACSFKIFLWICPPARSHFGSQFFPVLFAPEHGVRNCLVRICLSPSTRRFTSLFRVRGPPCPVRLPEFFRVGSPRFLRPFPSARSLAFPLVVSLFGLRHRCRGLRSRGRKAPPWCCHCSNLALTISVYWPTDRTCMARGWRRAS